MMHIEWDTAECEVTLYTAEDAAEDLRPDVELSTTHVLVLGGAGGGALAIESDLDDLVRFADEVSRVVRAAHRAAFPEG